MTSFFFQTCGFYQPLSLVQQDDADCGWASTNYHRKFRRSFHLLWACQVYSVTTSRSLSLCSVELMKALEKGYQMLQLHKVWHFPDISHELFAKYINIFLKIKQEAVVTQRTGWLKKQQYILQKQQYIEEYFEWKSICLDPNKIKKNPGLRALAKLMLNSFWVSL